MGKYGEKAKALFTEGYNCAQAVFAAFSDVTGIDFETSVKLSSGFGGGMGRMREVCGAVSGMFMVLGTLYGYDDAKDDEAKKVPVEIQFRTLAMDMWASLEHELRYKSKNQLSEYDKYSLRKYSDDLYEVDLNMQRIYIKTTVGENDND